MCGLWLRNPGASWNEKDGGSCFTVESEINTNAARCGPLEDTIDIDIVA